LQGKFIFEGFTEGCGNNITYQIAASGKKTPNGLTGQILNEQCRDKNCISIISETQLSSDIEFFLYVTGDGVEQLIVGPLFLLFKCLMESKPEISVPASFNETQIFTLETPEDIPFF